MLTMPVNWRAVTGGFAVVCVLEQVREKSLQQQMAWNLIGACLDLAAAGIALRGETAPAVKPLRDFGWQFGDYTYQYIHDMNDAALARAVELGTRTALGNIIVPPRHDEILWRACHSILKNRTPSILGLDTLINLRTLFSSGDFGWQHERVMRELVRRHNQRVVSGESSDAILIAV